MNTFTLHTLYIYNVDNNEVVAQFKGETDQECLDQAEDENYLGVDELGATFTAFGLTF